MDDMRRWYNGYQMSDYPTEKIYNPYSVLLYLKHQKLKNYWFGTGTPTFLIKLIQKNLYVFTRIDHSEAGSSMLDSFEVEKLPLITLLYQSGYLTIETFNERRRTYKLMYPNEEVRQSLNESLLQEVLPLREMSTEVIANQLRDALYLKDMTAFCATLQSLLARIPYQLHLKKEAFYHALLQMICYMLGVEVSSQVSVAGGITDMVIKTATTIFVFEFKLDATVVKKTTSEQIKRRRMATRKSVPCVALTGAKAVKALKQIHDRRYYESYLHEGKEVYLVGLSFNYKAKSIMQVVEKVVP